MTYDRLAELLDTVRHGLADLTRKDELIMLECAKALRQVPQSLEDYGWTPEMTAAAEKGYVVIPIGERK